MNDFPLLHDGDDSAYALFAAFRVSTSHPVIVDGRDVPGLVQEIEDVSTMLASEDVEVSGWYDSSGFHHEADLFVVLSGESPEDLQWGLRELRRTALLRPLVRVDGGIGKQSTLQDGEVFHWLAVAQTGPLELTFAEADDLENLPSIVLAGHIARVGRRIEVVEIVEVVQ